MPDYPFPGKGKVAILKTRPETILDDVGRVMQFAGYQEALPKDLDTVLRVNISWQTWYSRLFDCTMASRRGYPPAQGGWPPAAHRSPEQDGGGRCLCGRTK